MGKIDMPRCLNEHVFIVVPVYNVEKYLDRCVKSVLNQTYDNFSLLLVDDGSNDHSADICDIYKKKDSRISVIHQDNGGLSSARNTGINWAFKNSLSAIHEWVTFIDSDDWIHEQYLELLMNSIEGNNVKIAACQYYYTNDSHVDYNITNEKPRLFSPENLWTSERTIATLAWCKIYRLDLFEDVRYPYGKIHEDEYTTYKLLFKCNTISLLNDKLYFYFHNEAGIMHSAWNPKRLDSIDAHKEQMSFFRDKGYFSAFITSQRVLLLNYMYHLRAMEVSKFDIIQRRKIFREMYRELVSYGKNVGYTKAVQLWFHYRILHRIKKIVNKIKYRRIINKFKGIIKLVKEA